MQQELLSDISTKLNIPVSSDPRSLCRLIYSTAGKMALSSLWDSKEDMSFQGDSSNIQSKDDTISVQHFKPRIGQIINAFTAMYPEVKDFFTESNKKLKDEIYETYRRTGFFYHSPYRISPAPFKASCSENCVLYRGVSPCAQNFMSGLGFYGFKDQTSTMSYDSVAQMFDLSTQPLQEYLQEVLSYNDWKSYERPADAMFLRTSYKLFQDYWQDQADKTGIISLARYGSKPYSFLLYRFYDGAFQQKYIPNWMITDFRATDFGENNKSNTKDIYRLENAVLANLNQLPPIKAEIKDKIVSIQLGYKLPVAEADFLRLYSWPHNYKEPKIFKRDMALAVYPVFKQHMEQLGYQFEEKTHD